MIQCSRAGKSCQPKKTAQVCGFIKIYGSGVREHDAGESVEFHSLSPNRSINNIPQAADGSTGILIFSAWRIKSVLFWFPVFANTDLI